MTNTQLYLAIGLPCFTIVTALVINLIQIAGIKEDIREIRGDLKHIVQALNELDKRVSIIEERLER